MRYLFALLLVLTAVVPANAANCWWNGYRWECPYSEWNYQPYQWHAPDFWRWHEHHEHRDRWEHREHR